MADQVSKTAVWVAAARAIGAREPDPAVRNPDNLAEQLLGDPTQLVLGHPMVEALSVSYDAAMQEMEVADMVRAMIERTRFIDQALDQALAAGVKQLLIPGAGLDSHAYRYRERLDAVSVFEVDRPATLKFKQQRVNAVLGEAPENVTFVPVDFQSETLSDALPRHGYDPSQPTFVILEGVTMYLNDQAIRETFGFIASHPAGSSVVFDFAMQPMVDSVRDIDPAALPESARQSIQRFIDMTRQEPWQFGFTPGREREQLLEFGLETDQVLTIGSEESVGRFLTSADGSTVGQDAHERAEAMREATQLSAMGAVSEDMRAVLRQRLQEQRERMAYRIALARPVE
jgi:methyltransferase (TIGR00027 family)